MSTVPKERIYVVEADCDRPGEGKFLGKLLNPEVTLWLNVSRTHSMNFDSLVRNDKYKFVDEAIAFEFGYLGANTKKLVVMNGDNELEMSQINRITCEIRKISLFKSLKSYKVDYDGTEFVIDNSKFVFNYLFPKEIATSILMCKELIDYLDVKFDSSFSKLTLPPGRNSIFKGVKDITIIDSAYNASLSSMEAILGMYSQIISKNKWVVLGDMLEQGIEEKEEHEKLARLVSKYKFQKIILIGPRVIKYTYPFLETKIKDNSQELEKFLSPKEVLDYINGNIKGGEVILFKGARFLEGVIENLLLDKKDAARLDRREKIWEIRRKKFGL